MICMQGWGPGWRK